MRRTRLEEAQAEKPPYSRRMVQPSELAQILEEACGFRRAIVGFILLSPVMVGYAPKEQRVISGLTVIDVVVTDFSQIPRLDLKPSMSL